MLDNFKDFQYIPYVTLKNAVLKDKVSHAYLFVSNGYPKVLDFALSFAKFLLCPLKQTNNQNCNGCPQCNNIDTNNFTELKVIEPDGQWIKKEQLNDLQEEFNKKALIGERKVYIINHAEKLNTVSANSILKFLEEPVPNITAILIVDNQFQLLETIISRCQIINLNKLSKKEEESYENNEYSKLAFTISNTKEEIDNYVSDDYKEKLDQALNFINTFENKKISTILDTNKLFHDYFKEKNDIIYAFEIFILYYKDILNYMYDRDLQIFINHENDIKNISKNNTTKQIIDKINILLESKNNLNYNANINLLIDKLIIDMDGV